MEKDLLNCKQTHEMVRQSWFDLVIVLVRQRGLKKINEEVETDKLDKLGVPICNKIGGGSWRDDSL